LISEAACSCALISLDFLSIFFKCATSASNSVRVDAASLLSCFRRLVRQMCDTIAVMRNGSICEVSDTETLFVDPKHEYSRHLINLMPRIDLLS
jgi:ABC-type antimicrobial peptide transport system ATPase subunit